MGELSDILQRLESSLGPLTGEPVALDLDPSLLTTAFAAGAREGGCRVFTHTHPKGERVRRPA